LQLFFSFAVVLQLCSFVVALSWKTTANLQENNCKSSASFMALKENCLILAQSSIFLLLFIFPFSYSLFSFLLGQNDSNNNRAPQLTTGSCLALFGAY